MAQGKKRRKYKRRSAGASWNLGATPQKDDKEIYKELGLSVLSFVAGQAAGAALGKTSGYVGVLVTGAGFWKKNIYATSFGAGMTLAEANGPSGFTLDSVKERSMGFAGNVWKKFTSPMGGDEAATTTTTTAATTNGLGEGTQQPKYFLNPYTQNQDFSQAMRELENMEAKVREVSGIEDEIGDLEESNY